MYCEKNNSCVAGCTAKYDGEDEDDEISCRCKGFRRCSSFVSNTVFPLLSRWRENLVHRSVGLIVGSSSSMDSHRDGSSRPAS